MAHEHHDHDSTSYYLEQLGSIAVAGALGVVSVLMWQQGMLRFILAPVFHVWVLGGGIALLVAVAVRAVTLWLSTGAQPALANGNAHHHEHEHEHHHDSDDHACCGHDHAHHDHHDHHHAHAHDPEHVHTEVLGDVPAEAHAGQDHGHDHGWNSWRYAILLLPVVLYLLNLPNQGFSQAHMLSAGELGNQEIVTIANKEGAVLGLDFKELDRAANSPALRAYFEGRRGWLEGQFVPNEGNRTVFSMVRFKITCCAADAVQLNLVIVSPENVTDINQLDWVRVEGQIQFRKLKDKEQFMPVLQLGSSQDVQVLEHPPSNPYIQ